MILFTEFDIELGFRVCESMLNHTWYLTQQWAPACLADEDCPEDERKAVAVALANTDRPDHFKPGKPVLPKDIWPEEGERPSLSSFVGPSSWLLPHLLGLTNEQMEGLRLEVYQWHLMSGFRRFSEFVNKIQVVNDAAERAVKLIQDFVGCSEDETVRQERMISAGVHKVETCLAAENQAFKTAFKKCVISRHLRALFS